MSCNEKREVAGLASELFQSLSGFPMSCNGTSRSAWGPAALFQSLSGFPMSCNRADREHRHDGRHVSIPIGFSNELQLDGGHEPVPPSFLFQSLSGFPMSCNGFREGDAVFDCLVSIPIGFSNELQRKFWPPYIGSDIVSIPIGFSNELQPNGLIYSVPYYEFQSLSGFPMSCNVTEAS